jgi:MFS family permease
MLIRALTPPGQIGKVFGFVSTGFNIGGIVAPPVFGLLLDHAEPNSVFWIAGLLAFATTATVLLTGQQSRRSKAASYM